MSRSFLKVSVLSVLVGMFISVDTVSADGSLDMPILEDQEQTNKLYVFALGGGTSFDVVPDLIAGMTLNDGALDDDGSVFELGVGYDMTSRWFIELAYQYAELETASMDTFYSSVNYRPSADNTVNPYVGLLVGYSEITWDERPYPMLVNEDLTSSALSYGVQAGLEMRMNERISFAFRYQYIKHDQVIEILTDSSIAHDDQQNIMIGAKYDF